MTQGIADVFEQVADMIIKEDGIAPPKTDAFIKLLSLQFTESEAKLALQVRTTGGTLSELAERTGIKADKLQKKLLAMADKGTIYYEGDEDPHYRVVKTAAPGFTETGLWGGVRYPYTVELGKAMYDMTGSWATGTLAKLGFPYAPVWPALEALPEDADPAHNLAEAIKNEGHWSVSACPCRLSHWLADPGNHCDHMLESCVITGEESRWAVKHGHARALTYEQCVEVLKECNRNGLVSTLNVQNNICNCCNDCCGIFRSDEACDGAFIPSPYMAAADDEKCNGCNKCAECCPVSAIEVEQTEGEVSIDQATCFGCGLCVVACKPASLFLTKRPDVAA